MSRVTDIRYVGYGVEEFDSERAFYADKWGLVEVAAQDGMAWFAAQGDDEHHVVRLHRSDANHVEVIALAADSRTDVDALHDKVAAAGCKVIHEPRDLDAPGGGFGFRFFSPDGLPFEISADVAKGEKRAIDRWEGLPVRISHIVLHSPDHQAAVRFFCDLLGFRVSDWLGDFMCFLRCNSAHHRLAVLPGPPCLNHVAYDMTNADGMLRGVSRLKQADIDIRWGPGRHTAGDNTFSYFVSPGGFVVEYTAELEEVDFETHEAQVHAPGPRIMDQWGIGIGGPQTMPHTEPDPRLFQPAEA
ncbi:VOC family protein [Alteraurantiacibacter aestuarii]|uniref:Oxidoreductase n=1 Tax=Alteraurantiacibacter aestuarii TaxID=650004 RepID=A0A844ZIY6_9SPHN|nr:VOC family protein [Alteraurantiacibacter aestuarii]MXO87242.1 oxidoreductase [Alteraurantiacibacter aestuarii]